MRHFLLICTAFFVCTSVPVFGQTAPGYQQGKIVKQSGQKTFQISGRDLEVWVSPCGDFQAGQDVEYRIDGANIYVRGVDGNEHKCSITKMDGTSAAMGFHYESGTILGYKVRRDTVEKNMRLAKVYELRGSKLLYQIDYCGSFQAGKFTPGQIVQFRVDIDNDRLYVRHDGDKEYDCQLEGMRLIDTRDGRMADFR